MDSGYVFYMKRVLDECGYLGDMYMIDYFVEDLWNKLPGCWRNFCENELKVIGSDRKLMVSFVKWILRRLGDEQVYLPVNVEPLSMMSLRKVVQNVCLQQSSPLKKPADVLEKIGLDSGAIEGKGFTVLREVLPPSLRLKIKQKKEHELSRIVDVIKIVLDKVDAVKIDEIIDIGAGIGHLSRVLSLLIPGKTISTVEGDAVLVEKASKIDQKMTKSSKNETTFKKLERRTIFVKNEEQLGDSVGKNLLLTGLHTCGDFAATIIRHFAWNADAKMLLNFGCCYHKLNAGMDKVYRDVYEDSEKYLQETLGYPMSTSFSQIPVSYAAREVACFGHEQFVQKLDESVTKQAFFVNCYRSILEWIILDCPQVGSGATIDGTHRHKGLRGFRGAESMGFWEYADEALRDKPEIKQRFEENVKSRPWIKEKIKNMVDNESEKTLLLYTFRLLIAPVIEAVILRDRQAFLVENGIKNCHLFPLFDPMLSPRNVALFAWK